MIIIIIQLTVIYGNIDYQKQSTFSKMKCIVVVEVVVVVVVVGVIIIIIIIIIIVVIANKYLTHRVKRSPPQS